MTTRYRRLALCLAVLFAAVPAVLGQHTQESTVRNDYFEGKVVALAPFLEKQGAKMDADAGGLLVALVTSEGKIYPLLKETGARMFFLDKMLLDRPMRLTGRLIPNSQLLQVINVHSYLGGKLHEVYYWCDTCSIRDSEPGDCHCCGAKFEFRETPVK